MTQQKELMQHPTWQEFQKELILRATRDEHFRRELIADPKDVVEREMSKLIQEFKLPETVEIKVIEQPTNSLYIVLPAVCEQLSDEMLDDVTGGLLFGYQGPLQSNWFDKAHSAKLYL